MGPLCTSVPGGEGGRKMPQADYDKIHSLLCWYASYFQNFTCVLHLAWKDFSFFKKKYYQALIKVALCPLIPYLYTLITVYRPIFLCG